MCMRWKEEKALRWTWFILAALAREFVTMEDVWLFFFYPKPLECEYLAVPHTVPLSALPLSLEESSTVETGLLEPS